VPLPAYEDTKLWLALLRELDQAGGKAKPVALYPKMRAYFPQITDADIAETLTSGDNKWRNRIRWARQFLVERGCIDQERRGVWNITPAGRAWLKTVWRGPRGDYSAVVKPAVTSTAQTPSAPLPPTTDLLPPVESVRPRTTTVPAPAAPVAVVVDPAEQLCARLLASQRRSSAPQHTAGRLPPEHALVLLQKWLGGSRR
jgi:hypothetical protein